MSVCPTCGQRKRRSLPQNSRLHSLFMLMQDTLKAKDGESHSAMWWKVMSKSEYLGFTEFRKPDGSVIQVLRSTADCDVSELNEFMEKVEAYCSKRGVYLDD
jgi:hypothetical protein